MSEKLEKWKASERDKKLSIQKKLLHVYKTEKNVTSTQTEAIKSIGRAKVVVKEEGILETQRKTDIYRKTK
jgi:hypothetical protein